MTEISEVCLVRGSGRHLQANAWDLRKPAKRLYPLHISAKSTILTLEDETQLAAEGGTCYLA